MQALRDSKKNRVKFCSQLTQLTQLTSLNVMSLLFQMMKMICNKGKDWGQIGQKGQL
jgi:hypothetical protein